MMLNTKTFIPTFAKAIASSVRPKKTTLISATLLACGLCGSASAGYYPMYYSWQQPDGPGSPITLSYSYSNLFDGSLIDARTGEALPEAAMRSAFERALQDYAEFLPIHFVEVKDNNGPLPETGDYNPEGFADIRVGQVANIRGANAYAYFPYSETSGLAGDIVFNAERFGAKWTPFMFYAIAQHELGHSLGMGHYIDEDNSSQLLGDSQESVNEHGDHDHDHDHHDPVLDYSYYDGPIIKMGDGMVQALQNVYGAGVGSVSPVPLPAGVWLFASGAALLLGQRKLRRQSRYQQKLGQNHSFTLAEQ